MDGKSEPVNAQDMRDEARIGLVLGGGAALGLAHVGVIRALEKENIPIDVVAGCSMGALVGGLWAAGRDADELEKIAKEFSKKSGMLKLCDPPVGRGLVLLGLVCASWALGHAFLAAGLIFLLVLLGMLPGAGVVKGRAIGRWLKSKFGRMEFHDARIPLRVVGYDLLHQREIVLDQGLIADAVYRSIAIPGIIPPVMGHGQMVVDGGVLDPLPVKVLMDMGIRKIIAVDVLQSPEEVRRSEELDGERLRQLAGVSFFRHPWQYIVFRLGRFAGRSLTPNIPDVIVRTLQASQYIFAQTSGRQADVLISPDLTGIQWFELYEADQLIRRGYEEAMRHIPAIRALVGK